ncbi:hypothetical protein Ocin01_17673 [Orchesella cincta]|uniref:Uncharacterized protein n=1 Tax=Orchesella cincta TaxID=48709 RepID=A0A1D2M7V5_ORCCI|nr:hypothetical protein Ocin01_17673 [Orchesella cincta]
MDKAGVVTPAPLEPAEIMASYDEFPAGGLPEVWLNVLNKLDQKDKLAVSGASAVWHDWMEPERTQFLISEVTPYLVEPHRPVDTKRGHRARELCQSWKEGLDHQNQTHGSNTNLYFEMASCEDPHQWYPCRRSLLCGTLLIFLDDVQRFMEDMKSHPENPFPGRSIHLCCSFQEDNDPLGEAWDGVWREYWSNTYLLLEKFGSHVHFADIMFNEDEEYEQLHLDDMEVQARLRGCLLRLPNIKQLHTCSENKTPLLEEEISEYYRRNPLPRLEDLETVELQYMSLATINEVLNSCCVPTNIKRLSYRHIGLDYQERLTLCDAVYGFTNLEVLSTSILLCHLERLARLEQRPPLREVDLRFREAPYLQEVLSLLEAFAGTLIQFKASSTMRVRMNEENERGIQLQTAKLEETSLCGVLGTPELLFQFESVTHLANIQMRGSNGEKIGSQFREADE